MVSITKKKPERIKNHTIQRDATEDCEHTTNLITLTVWTNLKRMVPGTICKILVVGANNIESHFGIASHSQRFAYAIRLRLIRSG